MKKINIKSDNLKFKISDWENQTQWKNLTDDNIHELKELLDELINLYY